MTLGEIDGANLPIQHGPWLFDEDDFLLMALLSDEVYGPELTWHDPQNTDYSACYRVRDYQYKFRPPVEPNPYRGHACARSTGKTEDVKRKAFTHPFRRVGTNLLITAPELIHLLPLTDAIEDRIHSVRLTRDFLDTRGQKTGLTHRPFGVDFWDNTKIVGRIPRLTGTGVKGQHQPDLIVDEAQDYPERGWIEVHETVMKDGVDPDGNPDFSYLFYGVHSGARDSGFYKRTTSGGFKLIQVTAHQRPGWGKAEKEAAKAAYGGTSSPDYRRNILGEPGAAASAFFVISRLMACIDQGKDGDPRASKYNTHEYEIDHDHIYRAEEVDELQLPIAEILNLPTGYKSVWAGADLGLTESPTVLSLWSHEKINGTPRLKLFRRLTLERFRPRQIREAFYSLSYVYGDALKGLGIDITGLGFPIFQDMEDDEAAPRHLLDVAHGYMFNAKVPVGVEESQVSEDSGGNLRDGYGNVVKVETDPLTGVTRYVTYMTMIEASTRYLREFVDTTFLALPFDTAITQDMLGETQQRVRRVGELRKKPNAFHILDSFRAMAMAFKSADVEEALALPAQQPVLARAMGFPHG